VKKESLLKGPGLLFVVSGPSGAGKDTVVHAVQARLPSLRRSVSTTTRQPRAGEVEGESYFFLDRPTFEARRDSGEFLETNEYNGHLYGTPRSFVERTLSEGYDLITTPEVNGALAMKSAFAEAVLIFLLPDKFSHLRTRLAARRSETNEEIAARLAIAHQELTYIRSFDYVVINEQAQDGDPRSLTAVDDLESIVRAERFRIHHYPEQTIKDLANS